MFLKSKKTTAPLLLVLLTVQSVGLLSDVFDKKEKSMISTFLQSPEKKELTLLSQFSTMPLLNNDKVSMLQGVLPVSTNEKIMALLKDRMVITWDDITTQKYFSSVEFAERQARIKLLSDLQFTNKDNQNSIVRSLGKTITRAGQACFMGLLSQVNIAPETTKKRQAFIKALVDSPELLKKLQDQLQIIADREDTLAAQIPLAPNPLEAMSQAKKAMMIVGLEVFLFYAVYLFNPAGYAWLKNMAIGNGFFALMYALSKLAQTEAAGSLGVILNNLLLGGYFAGAAAAGLACLTNYQDTGKNVLNFITKGAKNDYKIMDRLALPALAAVVCYGIWMLFKVTKSAQEAAFKDAQRVAQVIRGIDAVHKDLASFDSPAINRAYTAEDTKILSPKWAELLGKASNSAFDNDKSYHILSSANPKVLNLIGLLPETLQDFAKAVQFYGEVDAYAAMAQLYLDTRASVNDIGEPIRTSFAELLEDIDDAQIHAHHMWHPILLQQKVRTVSLSLGEKNAHNMIITGPNAAGKSVAMKALLANVLLAKTFGIACAESFALSPYAKIIARFSSVDDTANNQSKFMAEAFDVVSVLKQADDLQEGEKMLVVTDELFSGTELEPAVLLSTQLCAEIARNKNVNYVLATHYKDLTALKELTGGAFENYKVTASVDDQSVVSYPFTLTQGVGDVNVAFDIFLDQMRKQGVSNPRLEAIIKNARERKLK